MPEPVIAEASRARGASPTNNGITGLRWFQGPAGSSGEIRFALRSEAVVSMKILDIEGREVARPLDRANRSAGEQTISLGAQRWRPGIYFCSIEAGSKRATTKFAVIR
jgi:hypothetical protein